MVSPTSTGTTITEATGSSRLGLRAAIDSWRLSLRAANRSPATIKTYLDAATRFEAFRAERGMPVSLEAIRREHIEAFLVALQDAGSRPATVSLAYRCLQAFWKWAVSEDEVRESPMARMTPPIVPEEPSILGPEQIRAILDACAETECSIEVEVGVLAPVTPRCGAGARHQRIDGEPPARPTEGVELVRTAFAEEADRVQAHAYAGVDNLLRRLPAAPGSSSDDGRSSRIRSAVRTWVRPLVVPATCRTNQRDQLMPTGPASKPLATSPGSPSGRESGPSPGGAR